MSEALDRKRVLLLFIHCDGMLEKQEEMGIASIASYLRKCGHFVELLACGEDAFEVEQIAKLKPDIVGATLYDVNKNAVFRIYSKIKRAFPFLPLCVGGHHATLHPRRTLLECSDLDVVVTREGETPFLSLVGNIDNKNAWADICGIVYRREPNGMIRSNPNGPACAMDQLPFPARDLLEQYNIKVAQISTARGCSADCSFCVTGRFYSKWTGRTPQAIADEVEGIYRKYGIRAFNVIDCSFEDPGVNIKRMTGFAEQILERGLTITYYVQMKARSYASLDDRTMRLLRRSGLSTVCLGLEAGNEHDLSLYNKKMTPVQMKQAIGFFHSYDIHIDPGFINFNPYSSKKTLSENLKFLYENQLAANAMYLLKPCRIYPGTSLYEKIKKDDLIDNEKKLGYLFLNREVEQLYDFFHDTLRAEMPYIRAASHGASFDFVAFHSLKTIFGNLGERECYMRIAEIEKEHMSMREQINERVSNWFCALLDVTGSGWTTERALQVSRLWMSRKDWAVAAVRYAGNRKRAEDCVRGMKVSPEIIDLAHDLFSA